MAFDHYLAKREQAFGPRFRSWTIGESAAAFFGRDDTSTFRAISGHRIDYRLRPGERLVYRWDNEGKLPAGVDQSRVRRKFWGNSLWIFAPILSEERLQEDAVEFSDQHCVFAMTTPYALCGGRVSMDFVGVESAGEFSVAVSVDSLTWQDVWHGDADSPASCQVDLDTHLRRGTTTPRYTYFVRIDGPLAFISHLQIESDLMVWPFGLPRLPVGDNMVTYFDDSPGPHEITITHRWRESASVPPPPPPERPDFPEHCDLVMRPTIPFDWPAVADADLYHLQVSRRPDMRLAYRPTFDVMVEQSELHSPFPGLFNPDEDYFWRVKARNSAGVWGDWSEVWSFRWEGPRVPVDLVAQIEGEEIIIAWQPNPRGPPPTHYEIYGSDERGFTPSKTVYQVQGLGEQPANFLGATKETCYLVVSDDATHSALNRSFYRVVAVDRNGVAGGPSQLLELPHPFIFSKPVAVAHTNAPYRYQARSLTSCGDLQKRYVQPIFDYWEREGCAYEMVAGPAWLSIDAETGVLSGIPPAAARGAHAVTIVCRRTYPFEQGPDEPQAALFQKGDERFQAEHRQTFELVVE